ncbi:hypothetical protein [Paractinoplanes lichenicola]|uniref:Uncharacterized protein n=1 Tax=Paractinoplanes lichenicola TaxID=2802976 RepID=A0ABS1VRW1_9ACTN|nr:hypothetical protein [Actinoplanes lichenicola]MBL7256497.1 hypothetical protein [Actinoplanes lichenicola]
MAGSAREEAERLVATVLARAVAGQAFNDKRWATGEPECCVCPVCKAIAAMRDPKPETAAKLAGGASDLAGSVAGLLRSVSAIVGEKPKPVPPAPAKPGNADQTWSAATRADSNTADSAWAAAINAEAAISGQGHENKSDLPDSGGLADDGPVGTADDGLAPPTPTSIDKSDLSGTGAGIEGLGVGRGSGGEGRAGGAGAVKRGAGAVGRGAGGFFGDVVRDDPWASATTSSAAAVAKEHAAELAERRAAALKAAAEAERRVAEAAEQAKARREAAAAKARAEGGEPAAGERGPRRVDVWAAATADAGVADVASGAGVDHDVAGAAASGGVGDDEAGSAARDDDAGNRDN